MLVRVFITCVAVVCFTFLSSLPLKCKGNGTLASSKIM